MTPSQVLSGVRSHQFHPLEEGAFTRDRASGEHGIADLDDRDWQIRLLALRDLVVSGDDSTPQIIAGLADEDQHVRQVCAAALGVLRAGSAVAALERLLQVDPSSIVRSQAATALGQMESRGSVPLLGRLQSRDPSRDVQHQCELAVDQIEKGIGATAELRRAFADLDPVGFEAVRRGEPAPAFSLEDTERKTWGLGQFQGQRWVVLIWVFADWCPVCHGEFRELIEMRQAFAQSRAQVFTIECHDLYRGRVMVGNELEPQYWFSDKSFKETYTKGIWWPHLLDRAGAVGAVYGVDPMAFAVHAEYINRPSTIIVDPEGIVRFAYYGTFWGDRPSVAQTLEMIRMGRFDFEHPRRLRVRVDLPQ